MPRLSQSLSSDSDSIKEDEIPQVVSAAVKVLKAAEKSDKMLGIFCSAAGGPHQAIYRAIACGSRSVSFFIKNHRRWVSSPFTQDVINQWFDVVKKTGFSLKQVVPHGTYFLNPASPEALIRARSRSSMLDDCRRCEQLGIKLYCFHPGSTLGICTIEKSIRNVADVINYVHKKTNSVTLLLETMAGEGHTIGVTFEELCGIINNVHNKKRVGVCLDTSHVFAAGYDIRTKLGYEEMMHDFEKKIGIRYLKAIHLNDSKREVGSFVDRHANIGRGKIGLDAFSFIMKDSRLKKLPIILETPPRAGYAKELFKLYALEKMRSRRPIRLRSSSQLRSKTSRSRSSKIRLQKKSRKNRRRSVSSKKRKSSKSKRRLRNSRSRKSLH